MSNKRRPLPEPARMMLALAASMLLHVLLLSGVNLEMPDLMAERDTIEVKLAPQVKPPAEVRPEVKPEPVQIKPRPLRQKRVRQQESPPPPPVPEPTPTPVETAEAPSPIAAPQDEGQPSSAESAGSGSGNGEPAAEVEESRAPRGYKKVDAEYRLYRGKGPSVGEATYAYRTASDGSYRLSASAEASGLVALFVRGKYVQQSEGIITEHGLRPYSFSYTRGDDSSKNQKATFSWALGLLTMESGSRRETVPLMDGTQDMLSFLYQFMFVPPLEQMQLPVTNGKKFRVYSYGFEGEEILQTEIGHVPTFHIVKRTSDDEKTELWLAPDYRYLPVKMSQTDKDGTVTEQVIRHISVE